MRIPVIFCVIAVSCFSSRLTAQEETKTVLYKSSEALKHVGERATVTGLVTQVFESKKGNVFINIGGTYPSNDFTAVVFNKYVNKFSDLSRYEGKTVAVTGLIKLYNGKPEIIIESESQIAIR